VDTVLLSNAVDTFKKLYQSRITAPTAFGIKGDLALMEPHGSESAFFKGTEQ